MAFVNSNLAGEDFCRLLISIANTMDRDQAQQNLGSDLDPNHLTLMVFPKVFFLKMLILEKNQQTTQKQEQLSILPI